MPGQIFYANAEGPNMLIQKGAVLTQTADDVLKGLNLNMQKIKQKQFIFDNKEEQLISDALKEGSLSIDKIIEKTKLKAPIVAATLALMEISGKIRSLGGSTYAIYG